MPHPGYQNPYSYNAQQLKQPLAQGQQAQVQGSQAQAQEQTRQEVAGMDANEFVNRITTMMQSQFGLKPKGQVGSYQCPYQAWYDIVQLPPCYRVLDFSKFTGIDEMTTMEHISRYLF